MGKINTLRLLMPGLVLGFSSESRAWSPVRDSVHCNKGPDGVEYCVLGGLGRAGSVGYLSSTRRISSKASGPRDAGAKWPFPLNGHLVLRIAVRVGAHFGGKFHLIDVQETRQHSIRRLQAITGDQPASGPKRSFYELNWLANFGRGIDSDDFSRPF